MEITQKTSIKRKSSLKKAKHQGRKDLNLVERNQREHTYKTFVKMPFQIDSVNRASTYVRDKSPTQRRRSVPFDARREETEEFFRENPLTRLVHRFSSSYRFSSSHRSTPVSPRWVHMRARNRKHRGLNRGVPAKCCAPVERSRFGRITVHFISSQNGSLICHTSKSKLMVEIAFVSILEALYNEEIRPQTNPYDA